MTNEQTQQLVETKVYSINDSEFYELLPQEVRAIIELSNTTTTLSEYRGIMPVEVEEVTKLAEPLMWSLKVFEVVATPDPFLIGVVPSKVYFRNVPTGLRRKYKNYYSFDVADARKLLDEGLCTKEDLAYSDSDGTVRHYLLAQWGRELKPLTEIVRIAREKFVHSRKREYTEQKLEAEKKLAMLDLEAEELFGIIY